MRTIILTTLLLAGLTTYSQVAVLIGNVKDSTDRGCVQNVELKFLKNDTVIYTESSCYFRITLTKSLDDTIIVTNYALGTIKVPFKLKDKEQIHLDIHFPKSCKSLAKTDICPKCKSNKDVTKILYGMPTKKYMKLADKGKVRLGGCVINDCSPVYYCKKDNLEF